MYEVPRTNLHVWKCWHCREEPSAEFQLLRLLHQKLQDRPDCYVTRNAQYPKLSELDKAKTADGALVMNVASNTAQKMKSWAKSDCV